jgi:tape measure domain-containing protein
MFGESNVGLLFKIKAEDKASEVISKLSKTVQSETSQAGRAGSSNLGALNSATNQLSASVSNLGLSFKNLVGANLAASAIQATASAALSGASALLDYSARLEQVKISFTTLLGSGDKAAKLLKEIQEFAKTTPFEFEGLAKLSQRFVSAGVESRKVIPLIRDVGNAVSAVGGSQEDLTGVVRAMTQIISKGKVSAEEINQLAERNINGFKILADQLGKTEGEVRKLAEAGAISSDVFIAAFQKFSQINFGDAMQKQSETFLGALSNIKDSLLITASTAFNPLYERISRLAIDFSKEIEKQNGDFRKIGLVISEYIGIGLAQGVTILAEAFGSYLSTRLGEIFTGKAFFDPIVSSFIKGFDSGLQDAAGKIGLMFARFFGYAKPDPLQNVVVGRGDTEPLRALPDQPGVVYARSNEVSLLRKTTSDLDKILGGAKTSIAGLGGAADKAKKGLGGGGKSFDKEFREFAKGLDFRVTSTARTKVFNAGTKHTPTNPQAGDLSIKGKTIDEIVNVLAEGIKKGYRVIDERFKGAIPGINSTAPNAHFESAGSKKPSLFINNRPDLYGGKDALEFLKKLDEARRNKRTIKDDVEKFADERIKKEEDAAEKLARIEDDRIKRQESAQAVNLRTAVEGLNQEVALRASANQVILAEQETLLKNQEINEQGFNRVRAALDDDLFAIRKANKEKEFALLEAFNRAEEEDLEKQATRAVARAKPEDKAALEAKYLDELAALKRTNAEEESAIIIALLKLDDEITLKRIQNQNDLSAATKQSVEERKRDELALIEIRREVLRAEQDLLDFRNAQTRKTLENTIEFSRGKGQIAAIEALRAFEVREIEDKRARQIKALDDEEALRKEDAKKTIADKEVEEKALLELTKKYKILRDEVNEGASADTSTTNQKANLAASGATAGEAAGFLGESILTDLDEAGNRVTKLSGVFTELKDIAGSALSGLAQGIGSMVKNLVLLGNAGGQSFRKLTAELLASVAQQAAVIAVMELAYGFAALTPWGAAIYGSPTLHFKAAALMGSVAAIAGAAGRIAAGNSFQSGAGGSAASSAFKQSTANNSLSGTRTSREKEERVISEEERNQRNLATAEHNRAQVVRHEHYVTLDRGLIVREVGDNIRNRGDLHGLVIRTAEG